MMPPKSIESVEDLMQMIKDAAQEYKAQALVETFASLREVQPFESQLTNDDLKFLAKCGVAP